MNRSAIEKLSPGDIVIPIFGPFKDVPCTVKKIEMDAGAKNGWVTVKLKVNGELTEGLFAGEELRPGQR